MESLEEVRQYIRDLDSQNCPVAQRQRQLREEREREARKAHEAREQQRQAANISQERWDAIDERIRQDIQVYFGEGGPGGSSFIALYDDPGIPGDDGWQLLAGRGGRGPERPIGARGRKGERGARGEDAPTIISWVVDPVHYRAVPTMSNGRAGAPLDLRPLFEQFNAEAVLPAVDEATKDAARTKLLAPL
jgi:hypothetical protein